MFKVSVSIQPLYPLSGKKKHRIGGITTRRRLSVATMGGQGKNAKPFGKSEHKERPLFPFIFPTVCGGTVV